MEAIILAGGLGTRLRGTIGDYPKCMAEVNGLPFLSYLFKYLASQGCTRILLSLGYKHAVVTEWLGTQDLPFVTDSVVEHEPLGTGGGIQLAMKEAVADNVIVLNGDTLFLTDLRKQMDEHLAHHAAVTLGLKEMYDFDRYGVVNTNEAGVVTAFEEKRYRERGLINAGVYIVNSRNYLSKHLAVKHSFEKDYLERFTAEGHFFGCANEGYFIDIGIPEDYERAQTELKSLFV